MPDLPNYMQRRGPFDLPPELTFECRHGCGAAFSLESSLKTHESCHRRPEIRCPYYLDCKFSTFTDNKLQDHIETFHYNTNRHKCPTCDFAGPTQASLTKHRKNKHGFTQGAVQAKDYRSTPYSPKKPTPKSSPSRPSPANRHVLPSVAHATPSDRATGVARYPPPIRALSMDILNWQTTPPRK